METKRIALVTDAWAPQVNGVVQTLGKVCDELTSMGHEIHVIEPSAFRTIPCPTYSEISLALPGRAVARRLRELDPDHIHIATEGPLGIMAWMACRSQGKNFTTAFHTQFPEYIHKRFLIPLKVTYALMRYFHNKGKGIMVATPTVRKLLEDRGFTPIVDWCRGVDTELFNPKEADHIGFPRPILLYVGRVAVEKNIEAFLSLGGKGTKVVVGDGPALEGLKKAYPKAHFVGKKRGRDLARYYASSDVFVFPSRTDTFGLVMLEAMASGTPVAAYPVQGPLDVLKDEKAGVMNEDLQLSIDAALQLKREHARDFACHFSWRSCAEIFFSNLVPAR